MSSASSQGHPGNLNLSNLAGPTGIVSAILTTLAWVVLGRGIPRLFPAPFDLVSTLAITGVFLWWYVGRGPRRELARAGEGRWWRAGWARLLIALAATIVLHLAVVLLFTSVPSVTSRFSSEPPQHLRTALGFASRLATTVVFTPVIEEVGFRGWLLRALDGRIRPLGAVLVSATLFSLLHLQLWGLPLRFVMGFLCGAMVYRTMSIWPALLLHAAGNAVALIATVLGYPFRWLRIDALTAGERVAAAAALALVALATLLPILLRSFGRAARSPRPGPDSPPEARGSPARL